MYVRIPNLMNRDAVLLLVCRIQVVGPTNVVLFYSLHELVIYKFAFTILIYFLHLLGKSLSYTSYRTMSIFLRQIFNKYNYISKSSR